MLSDEREELRAALAEKSSEIGQLTRRLNAKTFRRCAYCSTPTYGYACPMHRELAQIDGGRTVSA